MTFGVGKFVPILILQVENVILCTILLLLGQLCSWEFIVILK